MSKPIYYLVLLSTLFGCSSGIRIVEADVPLVEPTTNILGEKLPAIYRKTLELSSSTEFVLGDVIIYIKPPYTSALGQECRELIFASKDGNKMQRIACAESKLYEDQVRPWYLIPSIVQSASSLQL